MSAPPTAGGEPITDRRQLVAWFESGCKPREKWRIGTEHEKFAFRLQDHHRIPYEGPSGVRALLAGMTRFGWQPVEDNGNPIALTREDGCNITLEPGGQFELSGRPLTTIHQTCEEVHEHLDQVIEDADVCEAPAGFYRLHDAAQADGRIVGPGDGGKVAHKTVAKAKLLVFGKR